MPTRNSLSARTGTVVVPPQALQPENPTPFGLPLVKLGPVNNTQAVPKRRGTDSKLVAGKGYEMVGTEGMRKFKLNGRMNAGQVCDLLIARVVESYNKTVSDSDAIVAGNHGVLDVDRFMKFVNSRTWTSYQMRLTGATNAGCERLRILFRNDYNDYKGLGDVVTQRVMDYTDLLRAVHRTRKLVEAGIIPAVFFTE